jgi:hypothetical protein
MKAVLDTNGQAEVIGPAPNNDGADTVERGLPYSVRFTIEGVAAILFHRWSNESVAAKAKAAKNSTAKKSDDVESYVWRDSDGNICLPGEYVRGAMVGAAKFKQDPRSPRKSAMDLYKAAVIPLTDVASLGTAKWDYLDERRVMVQRNAITRQRPAFNAGWEATFEFQVTLPEYVNEHDFLDTLALAGRVIGVGDFRPTYGRFHVTMFEQAF